MMPSNHFTLYHPLLLPPSIFPSIRVFPNESALHIRWPGVSASASVLSMNIQDWFPLGWTTDLLAVQGTLKSLLQHHSSKASILLRSAFFTVQLSYSYMTTGKIIALTRRTFVGKGMSLLFNMLSVGHSSSSKEQISFDFMAAVTTCIFNFKAAVVILEPKKTVTVFTVSPSICHEVMGPDVMILTFEWWVLSQFFYSP